MFGLLMSHVPLSLLKIKMADDGTKLCRSRSADGIATGPNGRYSGSSEFRLERMRYHSMEGRWPLLPQRGMKEGDRCYHSVE